MVHGNLRADWWRSRGTILSPMTRIWVFLFIVIAKFSCKSRNVISQEKIWETVTWPHNAKYQIYRFWIDVKASIGVSAHTPHTFLLHCNTLLSFNENLENVLFYHVLELSPFTMMSVHIKLLLEKEVANTGVSEASLRGSPLEPRCQERATEENPVFVNPFPIGNILDSFTVLQCFSCIQKWANMPMALIHVLNRGWLLNLFFLLFLVGQKTSYFHTKNSNKSWHFPGWIEIMVFWSQ
jgi:hypothetical protein